MGSDPEVMEFFPRPLDREQSDQLVDLFDEGLAKDGFGLWAVEETSSGSLCGFVGLCRPHFDAPFMPAVEIGWRLARAHWGKGLATEAAKEALRFGFEEVGLEEVVSFTVPANRRSLAVMERLGLGRDAALDFDHPALPKGHPLERHVLYRLSRDAWAKRVNES
jgi:RimJ/RimL family protein N-acetyltransferase